MRPSVEGVWRRRLYRGYKKVIHRPGKGNYQGTQTHTGAYRLKTLLPSHQQTPLFSVSKNDCVETELSLIGSDGRRARQTREGGAEAICFLFSSDAGRIQILSDNISGICTESRRCFWSGLFFHECAHLCSSNLRLAIHSHLALYLCGQCQPFFTRSISFYILVVERGINGSF